MNTSVLAGSPSARPAPRCVLDGINRLLTQTARISAYLSAAILVLCVAATMLDILLRNLMNSGVLGIIDLTQLAVMWAAFLSIPMGFAMNNHISVELLFDQFGPHAKVAIRILSGIAGALFMGACLWWGIDQAAQQWASHDRSATIGIPLILYWIPLLYGTALSSLCAFFAMFAPLSTLTAETHGAEFAEIAS